MAKQHGAAAGGRNMRQSRSVRGTETMGVPMRRSSAGVHSSPPKNGWITHEEIHESTDHASRNPQGHMMRMKKSTSAWTAREEVHEGVRCA
ncbi:Os09g0360966 [Oryza sativa Japonica Group]|uniref:Os09g0360966 protein n=2 Tax=Oryza TaxID=4527 RepID=A0A0P0XM27_ORYSJ|nr:Os09g0360966 [Oryza sativa Japonica Group]